MLSAPEREHSRPAEELLPLVYDELRRLAARKLAQEKPGQTLQATPLVHEAWLRLVREEDRNWNDTQHFFCAAGTAMRRILIENARRRNSAKHGGDVQRVNLDDVAELAPAERLPSEELLALDEALERLAAENADAARLLVPEAPRILTPPQTQTAETGATVCQQVEATGLPSPTCFWSFNATNCLSLGTNDLLRITNAQPQHCGAYMVVVSNAAGAVTSAPATLNVIAPVARRCVPCLQFSGQAGSVLNVEYADALRPVMNWLELAALPLANSPQDCFDLSEPLPPQRYYRARQSGQPSVAPALSLPGLIPALTLAGSVSNQVRVDGINQFGPIDAWFPLATVMLTNTSQLYFDVSALGQPARLYRLVTLNSQPSTNCLVQLQP